MRLSAQMSICGLQLKETGDTHVSYNAPFCLPESMSPEPPPDLTVRNPPLPLFFQFISEMFSLSTVHKCSCIVPRRRKKTPLFSIILLTIKHANVGATFNKLLWTFRRKERMNQQKSESSKDSYKTSILSL